MAQQDDDFRTYRRLHTMKMTAGMDRAVAIDCGVFRRSGGTVTIQANGENRRAPSRCARERHLHHPGHARMRWGDRLEFTAAAGPGDFIFVLLYVPHQEINASATLRCVFWCAATTDRW